MRSTLAEGDTFDGCAAADAGITVSLIHLEVILKITPAVNPINAGSIAFDAFN